MLKMRLTFCLTFLLGIIFQSYSQNDIAAARAQGVGKTVTVTGTAVNGSELENIRYIQDETGGLAVFSKSQLSNVKRGDKITVTGTLKNYFQLLEMDPVASLQIVSSGNPVIAQTVTPSQVNEDLEGKLLKIENAVFDNAGATFVANTNYNFSANGETGAIRISGNTHQLVGKIIPAGVVTLYAICSQYSNSSPTTGYQLLPRDANDIISSSSIFLTSNISVSNITKNSFSLSWKTNVNGTTEAFYGLTENLELGKITGTGNVTQHSLTFNNLQPADLVYVKVFSVSGNDTMPSVIKIFATQSNSTGNIIVHFTSDVDHSVSTGEKAIVTKKTADDTLVAYISRAKHSLDFCMYNFDFNLFSNVRNALNAAFDRGVKIRFISDGSASNIGIENLRTGIPRITSPDDANHKIMHNKIVIIDAYSQNPNDPIVWTGSTNLTEANVNEDANNVVIVQDQSLAKAYTLEFNEMWGSNTLIPDLVKSRFGKYKTDNTPHEFIIGGNRVELYFSPTEGVNSKIVDAIKSANTDLSIETMLITRTEIAYAITDKAKEGVKTNVIVDYKNQTTDAIIKIFEDNLKSHFTQDYVSAGIIHSKYLIVDQSNPISDPLILTGSHNWSLSANTDNDENTLIIHNASVANQFYQEFVKRFTDNNGMINGLTKPPVCKNDTASLKNANYVTVTVLNNDSLKANVEVTISKNPKHGTATVNINNSVTYRPEASSFTGLDTVEYKVAYLADRSLFAKALLVVNVLTGISEINVFSNIEIFPNPCETHFSITNNSLQHIEIYIFDINGKLIFSQKQENNHSVNVENLKKGIYFLELRNKNQKFTKKLIKN